MSKEATAAPPAATKAGGLDRIVRRPSVDMSAINVEYQFIKALGEGTFGKVMLGIHIPTGQHVAIKVIKKAMISQKLSMVQLEREIKLLSLVRHQHIARLYKVITTDDTIYLILEYCPGGELFEYIVARGMLTETQSRTFFRQILSAVHYCHQNHIIHRDLKLENMLLDDQRRVKVIDFGLANAFQEGNLLKTFCGTAEYAAPELLMGAPYEGPAVDVWALGVILYAMVVGALPYGGADGVDVVETMRTKRPFIPEHLEKNAVVSLIDSILTYDASRRPTTAQIWEHPWVREGFPADDKPAPIIRERIDLVDDDVVTDLGEMGFTREQIVAAVTGATVEASLTASAYFLVAERRKAAMEGDGQADWLSERINPGREKSIADKKSSSRRGRTPSLGPTLEPLQVERKRSASPSSPSATGQSSFPDPMSAPATAPATASLPTPKDATQSPTHHPPASPLGSVPADASPSASPSDKPNKAAEAAAAAAMWGGGTKGAAQMMAKRPPTSSGKVPSQRILMKQISDTNASPRTVARPAAGTDKHTLAPHIRHTRQANRMPANPDSDSDISDDSEKDFQDYLNNPTVETMALPQRHSQSQVPSVTVSPSVSHSSIHDSSGGSADSVRATLPPITPIPAPGTTTATLQAAANAAAKYATSQGARARSRPTSPSGLKTVTEGKAVDNFPPVAAPATKQRTLRPHPSAAGDGQKRRFSETIQTMNDFAEDARRAYMAAHGHLPPGALGSTGPLQVPRPHSQARERSESQTPPSGGSAASVRSMGHIPEDDAVIETIGPAGAASSGGVLAVPEKKKGHRRRGSLDMAREAIRGIFGGKSKKKTELRVVRGPFSCTTTSAKRASEVMTELERGMREQKIEFTLEDFTYDCNYDGPDGSFGFELEVCHVEKLDLRGLRFKRVRGNSWAYKQKLLQLLAAVQL